MDFITRESSSKEVEITQLKVNKQDFGKNIIIPSHIDGKKVTSLGPNVFLAFFGSSREEIEHLINQVYIPGDILLSEESFSFAPVKKFVIGSGIATIPISCFSFSQVEEIQFETPQLIKKIEGEAFSMCQNMRSFNWPEGCKEISPHCFDGCINLKSISGTDNVEKVGVLAFSCTGIEKFIWPAKCKTIPYGCFGGEAFEPSSLKEIIGINDVEDIEEYAFQGTAIEELDFPSKCKILKRGVFNISNLKRISFSSDNVVIFESGLPTDVQSVDLRRCSSVTIIKKRGFRDESPSSLFHSTEVLTGFDTDIVLTSSQEWYSRT